MALKSSGGIALSWGLDLFGRLRRATEASEAELQVALAGQMASSYFQLRGLQQQLRVADYRQTVLLALEETETWLLRYQQAHKSAALLQSATDAATQAVAQARDRYDRGFIGYYELLAAEQELTAMRNRLVQSETEVAPAKPDCG